MSNRDIRRSPHGDFDNDYCDASSDSMKSSSGDGDMPERVLIASEMIKHYEHNYWGRHTFDKMTGNETSNSAEDGRDLNLSSSQVPHSRIIEKTITEEAKIIFTGKLLTVFAPSVSTVVLIVSLPLNLLAIIMFLFKMKVRKPAVVYMLNLAAADVLFVTLLPFSIAYRFSGNKWMIGDGMCRFYITAFYCNMYCSILLMTSISVDRFLAVVYPMQSLSWRTTGRAWLVCVCIWVLSIAGTVPLLIREQTQYIAALDTTICYDVQDIEDVQRFFVNYFLIFISAFFFLPLVITVVCYIGIIHNLSSPKLENSFKRSRALFMTVTVLLVFVLCFGPTNVIFLIWCLHFHKKSNPSLYCAYILSVCISSISCCLDPLIYYYASSQCQRYMYSLLTCNRGGEVPSKKYQRNVHTKQPAERALLA
ncbi:proteinase-activated receptor 1-like isoform X1 [Pseudophryne corroboree]|uniref:proteinase-activated receptor 1-like isoform X1 n=2 Tax=Pseudophryne corroboree TaxID=495146 RepID=UPI003082058B